MKYLNLSVFLFLFSNIAVPSSSSCGELQNIVHNLPGNCGGNYFRLECKGNNPIFHIKSLMFIVKDISFENTTFRLVDPSCSATGDHCPLPNQTFPWDDEIFSIFFSSSDYTFIYFVNCTQKIEDSEYELLPCWNRTNSRVYAMAPSPDSYDSVSEMHDSCSIVGRTMTQSVMKRNGTIFRYELANYTSIMQAVENGVLVNWTARTFTDLSCSVLGQCWNKSMLQVQHTDIASLFFQFIYFIFFFIFWEPEILMCLYAVSFVAFSFMLVLSVLLDIFLITLFARIILAPMAICSFLLHKRWRVSLSVSSIEKFLRKNEILHIKRYDFIEISIMTNHFTEKLGQGGFGSVYRGKLLSGQHIAVKILSNSVGDGDDFISEVATIGRIHHTNIVRLVGFCSDGSKRALIYAYMPNGSLDKYIFSSRISALPMEKRREIAIGIARGVDYLHRGCEMQILHFDIKPHNILLGHDLTPKLSDFGLARLYPKDHNLVALTMARGTIGYIAPELISRTFGAISYKADVYSFGMLLMEMASGRRNVNNHAESSNQVYYPSWVYDQLSLPEEPLNLSNNNVAKFGVIEELLYKVALWCIQMKASNRPTMSRVIEMLQSDANNLEMPPRPFTGCSSQEFPVRSSEIESCSIELSLISEETGML